MNRLLTTIAMVTIVFLHSSCYKIWTCRCEVTAYVPGYTGGTGEYTETSAPNSKAEAQRQCDQTKQQMENDQSVAKVECTLK